MGMTRQAIPKMYDICKNCENNISSYGKCKNGFDNFYYRKNKNNGCKKIKELNNMYGIKVRI